MPGAGEIQFSSWFYSLFGEVKVAQYVKTAHADILNIANVPMPL
jgi:hypothetical protein